MIDLPSHIKLYLSTIHILTASGQGQQCAIESWLAPQTTKVTLNEGVHLDHKPGRDTTKNINGSPKVEPVEAVPIEILALEASKLLPPASAQDRSHLQAGMVDFHLSSFGPVKQFGKKGHVQPRFKNKSQEQSPVKVSNPTRKEPPHFATKHPDIGVDMKTVDANAVESDDELPDYKRR
jgi:hypothetical protein